MRNPQQYFQEGCLCSQHEKLIQWFKRNWKDCSSEKALEGSVPESPGTCVQVLQVRALSQPASYHSQQAAMSLSLSPREHPSPPLHSHRASEGPLVSLFPSQERPLDRKRLSSLGSENGAMAFCCPGPYPPENLVQCGLNKGRHALQCFGFIIFYLYFLLTST